MAASLDVIISSRVLLMRQVVSSVASRLLVTVALF
jgi:hypothetical protein